MVPFPLKSDLNLMVTIDLAIEPSIAFYTFRISILPDSTVQKN
jgi:hypothetical protein